MTGAAAVRCIICLTPCPPLHGMERGSGGEVERGTAGEARGIRSQRGFTLLEAVVALTIVGLAGVSALAAFGTELRTAERARRAVEGGALAQDRLATLEWLAPSALALLPDSLARGNFPAPFEQYAWSAKARAVIDQEGLYDLSTTVTWDDGSLTLDGRVYRPGAETGSR